MNAWSDLGVGKGTISPEPLSKKSTHPNEETCRRFYFKRVLATADKICYRIRCFTISDEEEFDEL
jgi:hypothetical protein